MKARRWISPLLATLLLLVFWELAVRASGLSSLLVAGPVDVAESLVNETDLLLEATLITATEALLGLLLACVAGAAVGVMLHLSRFLREATLPVIVASQAIPSVVLAPLLVIAFGFGVGTKVLIVALACFFPVTIGMFDGCRGADRQLIDLLRSLGASRWKILRLAELPSALPSLFSGIRIAATWAFVAAVFAEYAGATGGLGFLIARGTPTFATSRVYAAVLILTLCSLTLYGLTALLQKKLVPWSGRTDRQN